MKFIICESMTAKEVMATYKISRTTAWRAKKRGWLCVDYHKPTVNFNDDSVVCVGYLVAQEYADIRKNIFSRWGRKVPAHIIEDAISDSVLRCLERSQEILENEYSVRAWVYNGACYILKSSCKKD